MPGRPAVLFSRSDCVSVRCALSARAGPHRACEAAQHSLHSQEKITSQLIAGIALSSFSCLPSQDDEYRPGGVSSAAGCSALHRRPLGTCTRRSAGPHTRGDDERELTNQPTLLTRAPAVQGTLYTHHVTTTQEHPMLQAEMQRVVQQDPLQALDTSRFEMNPPPLNKQKDLEAWRKAVSNAKSQLEHQNLRFSLR